MMKRIALAFVLGLTVAGAAQAEFAPDTLLDLTQPKTLMAALQQAGYKAVLKTNSAGEPFIESSANGSGFTVEFYGCKGLTDCPSYQFQSWYKADPMFTPTLANDWNKNKRFIKLGINDKGELIEYMDMTATGKTTYAQFADLVDWYQVMDAEVSKFVAARRPAK